MKKKNVIPSSVAFAASCMRRDCAIMDAIRTIDRGGNGIALLVDSRGRLLGTLTDGDVRRALMQGATLEAAVAPFVQARFVSVTPEVGRAEVLDLMQARKIDQVPIVDARGRLCGLHLLHEIIGAIVRPNLAVIMAGGQGIRLRPATENLPKPM